MPEGHKNHCHRKNTRVYTKCPCQKHVRNPQFEIKDRHTQTKIYFTPDSTKDCVVFEYNKANKKWDISRYSSSQIKDRASVNEVEQFLNEINEPLEAWYQQNGTLVSGEGGYSCIGCLLLILFPLFVIYIWWYNVQLDKANAKL